MFRIITEGTEYHEHVLLRDGQGVLLRPGSHDDLPMVQEFLKTVSQDSLRMRFMASVSAVPESTLRDMCGGDFSEKGCLLAVTGEDQDARVIGIGNYFGVGNGKTAEVAFLVADEFQGRGVSTLILERLAGLAAAHGYVEFEGEVLFENQAMLGVFKSSGFEVHQGAEGGVMHVEFPVRDAAALRERGELRERIAVANSLAPLLRPRVVAVVGASRKRSSIGNMIFRHILHAEFSGTVYPVNLEAETVHGVRAYPSVADVPETVDLVVVAVPAEAVLGVAEQAVRAGAKGLLVVSSGFTESGPEGEERQRKLVELVRAHGVRLVGPNCLGIMNTAPEIHLNGSLAPLMTHHGPVGFFSQSAALGLVILEFAADLGVGFSTFVSAGNRADVSGNDLLQYWEEDPATEVILLYLESFGNPRRFTRIARNVAQRKPILCVKGARSTTAQATARTWVPATFGSEEQIDALFRQTGLIRAETLAEMFDIAVLLTLQPLPMGNRVAVVANSRGVATLFADACAANGLVISGPGVVDLGALTGPEEYEAAVRRALEHDEVDSLLVSFASVGDFTGEPVVHAIRRGVVAAEGAGAPAKPVLLCLMGATGAISAVPADDSDSPGRRNFPSFLFPESAPRALAKALQYAEFTRRKPGRVVWFDDVEAVEARRLVMAAIENGEAAEDGLIPVSGSDAAAIVARFGISVRETASPAAAVAPERDSAASPGAPESTGRSERDDDGLAAGDGQVCRLAIRSDRHFGPLLELGVRRGRPLSRITPLTDRDVAEMVEALGLADQGALGDLLARVSQMIEELPWLAAMEAFVRMPADGDGQRAVLEPGVTMVVRPPGLGAPEIPF